MAQQTDDLSLCLNQYNKDLAKVFESVQVDLQGISLLEQAGRDALINFANSGIGYIDYESYLAEVSLPVGDFLSKPGSTFRLGMI